MIEKELKRLKILRELQKLEEEEENEELKSKPEKETSALSGILNWSEIGETVDRFFNTNSGYGGDEHN